MILAVKDYGRWRFVSPEDVKTFAWRVHMEYILVKLALSERQDQQHVTFVPQEGMQTIRIPAGGKRPRDAQIVQLDHGL